MCFLLFFFPARVETELRLSQELIPTVFLCGVRLSPLLLGIQLYAGWGRGVFDPTFHPAQALGFHEVNS